MALAELTGVLGIKRAAHLLHRATFGATRSQIENVASLTAAQAVQSFFNNALPDPALPPDPLTGAPWFFTASTEANSNDMALQEYFKAWLLAQTLNADVDANTAIANSTREKIVFFIHTF